MHLDSVIAAQIIEACCTAAGLSRSLKDSLKKYPGSIHWHFKQQQQRGALEITLWPPANRLWFQIQAGRQAAWIAEIVPILRQKIEQALAQNVMT